MKPHREKQRNQNIFASLFRRYKKDEKGATAVEFALVAGPFFLILFAIIESAIFFFASQYLETTVDNVARQIRTGVLDETTTHAQFKSALCDEIVVMFDCNAVQTKVEVAASFDELTPSTTDDDGELNESFDPLGPQQIIQVTATYKWPVFTSYASPLRYGNSNFSLIHVTAVTRSEPFLTN